MSSFIGRFEPLWLALSTIYFPFRFAQQGAIAIDHSYFPRGAFNEDERLDHFTAHWYTEALIAMNEPPLANDAPSDSQPIYRFLWLRTFHHPVCARLAIHGATGTVVLKTASGAGGYQPGELVLNRTVEVSESEVQHFQNLLAAIDFWKTQPHSDRNGCDGAQWILEGKVSDRYRVIDRWMPKDGPLRELGLYLILTLGKLDISAKEIY